MHEYKQVPVDWLKPRQQARKQFDKSELLSLGESLKLKQLQPVGSNLEGLLLWGERRWRAAKLVGLTELHCVVTDEPLTESDVRLIQLTENIHRVDLLPHERWQACQELLDLNPDWLAKDLAKHLRLDPSMVTRLLSSSKCVPAVQEAFIAGRLGISDVYAISRASEGEQHELLRAKLGGATRDELAHKVRRKRSTSQVRVSRIRLPLAGMSVVVSGERVGLDELIETLAELLKQAKKAAGESLDIKTWAAVLADKAKVN